MTTIINLFIWYIVAGLFTVSAVSFSITFCEMDDGWIDDLDFPAVATFAWGVLCFWPMVVVFFTVIGAAKCACYLANKWRKNEDS